MDDIKQKSNKTIENIALNSTKWIGSTRSLIIHTLLFVTSFILYFFGIEIDKILLVITTIVSLEAIYLSIFIQMSINKQSEKLIDVAEDVEEIQKDVDEIQEDVDEIQEDVDEIQEDVDEIQEDVEEIQEDVDADIESTEDNKEEIMFKIENTLAKLIEEVIELKKQNIEKVEIKSKSKTKKKTKK
jgi:uncharacterized membrane protein